MSKAELCESLEGVISILGGLSRRFGTPNRAFKRIRLSKQNGFPAYSASQ